MMENSLFCQRKVGFRKRRELPRSRNYDYRLLSYETVNLHAENHTQAQETRIPWQRECDYYDYYFCFITQSVRYVWTRYDLSPTFTYHDVCVCAVLECYQDVSDDRGCFTHVRAPLLHYCWRMGIRFQSSDLKKQSCSTRWRRRQR